MSAANGTKTRGQSTRVPPHNLEAEESLLGAMLHSREAIGSAIELHIDADHFYKPAHGHVFAAIMDLWSQGQPADPVTVTDQLRRSGLLEQVGGQPAVVALHSNTPAIGNAARYARLVSEYRTLFRLAEAAGRIADIAYSLPDDVAAAVDEAEAAVFALRPRSDTVMARSLGESLSERLDAIDAMAEAGGLVERPTGFVDLDEMTAGLHPSTLTLVAGRPGSGKSSFALALTRNVAATGRPVVFVSVEMSEFDLDDRVLAAEARIPVERIRRGRLNELERQRIHEAAAVLSALPVHVVDAAGANMLTVRAEVRRALSRYGDLGLVVIDYVQIMKAVGKVENRQVEVAQLAQASRALAREMRLPVVALAQLSRSLEVRADKRPILADLRESGDLENTADVVIGLYRDEMYNRQSPDTGQAELIILKQRQGPTGTVMLAADLRTGRWMNMARGF